MSYAGDLTPTEAWQLLEADPDAVLVDVRTEPEWAFVGLPDLTPLGKRAATVSWAHWPHGKPNVAFLEELRGMGVVGGTPLVFICRSGHRSAAAAAAASQAGLAPAYNVLEGFEGDLDTEGHRGRTGWRARGLPWRQS